MDLPITVLLPTSPIPSCPQTHVIDTTYEALRKQLPDVTVLLLLDGYGPEVDAEAYQQYKNALKGKHWTNTEIVDFSALHHQAGMIRAVLDRITTPLVLHQEHDYPFCDDYIDWQGLSKRF